MLGRQLQMKYFFVLGNGIKLPEVNRQKKGEGPFGFLPSYLFLFFIIHHPRHAGRGLRPPEAVEVAEFTGGNG